MSISESEMQREEAPTRQRSRRLLFLLVSVALLTGLGALGLSIYNTARFDDRVQAYVHSHSEDFRGLRGPQGGVGATGPVGTPGLPGPRGQAALTDFSSFDACLSSSIRSWATGFALTTRSDYTVGSDPLNPPQVAVLSTPTIAPGILCQP
jgi:hypothetical protein